MDARCELVRVPPRGISGTYPLTPYVEVVEVAGAGNARHASWNLATAREVDVFFDRMKSLPNVMRQEAKRLLQQ